MLRSKLLYKVRTYSPDFARFKSGFAICILANLFPTMAIGEGHGNLDFKMLNSQQRTWVVNRIQLLAFEEALLIHCGKSDDFIVRAKRAIGECVTYDTLRYAEIMFRGFQKLHVSWLGSQALACTGPVVVGGKQFDDEAKVVRGAKEDLDYVVNDMGEMCRSCKTTIWAAFCH